MKVPEPRKLKSGTWFIQMRLNGVSVPVSAPTKAECKRMAALIKAEHRAGKRQISESQDDVTLSQAIDKYIAAKQNALSPSTIRNYRIIQKKRFQRFMSKPIRSIKNWQEVYDSEVGRLKPKTLKNSFGFLKSVYLFETGKQMPKVEIVSVPKTERPFLDAEQIQKFIEAVRGDTCEIPALLALSSLRCSEILALRWENVDLNKKRILVSGALVRDEDGKMVTKATNKTDASHRYVPIFIPQLYDALKAVENKRGRVADISSHGLYSAINRACKRAGLPEVGIHGLRHSFASLAVHLQMPEEVAMAIGGWSDFTTMRKIYTHISQKDMQDRVKQMESFFGGADQSANETHNDAQNV